MSFDRRRLLAELSRAGINDMLTQSPALGQLLYGPKPADQDSSNRFLRGNADLESLFQYTGIVDVERGAVAVNPQGFQRGLQELIATRAAVTARRAAAARLEQPEASGGDVSQPLTQAREVAAAAAVVHPSHASGASSAAWVAEWAPSAPARPIRQRRQGGRGISAGRGTIARGSSGLAPIAAALPATGPGSSATGTQARAGTSPAGPACRLPLPPLPPGLVAKPWAALLATHLGGEDCAICLDDLGAGSGAAGDAMCRYVQLKCRHSFCELCIRQHLECHGGRATCPQCRGALVA